MTEPYDSTLDTKKHIDIVRIYLSQIIYNLDLRRAVHDESKLKPPEKATYDKYTPLLRDLTYGSDEYKRCLAEMGPALKHHYDNNSHHPEHYENGVNDMTLLDVIEMLADWKAASLRHADGDIKESLKINKERFGLSDQLVQIFENTIKEMQW